MKIFDVALKNIKNYSFEERSKQLGTLKKLLHEQECQVSKQVTRYYAMCYVCGSMEKNGMTEIKRESDRIHVCFKDWKALQRRDKIDTYRSKEIASKL